MLADNRDLSWQIVGSLIGLVIFIAGLAFFILNAFADLDSSIAYCLLGIGLGWFGVFSTPKNPALELINLFMVINLTIYAKTDSLLLKDYYGLVPLSYAIYGIGRLFNPFKITWRACRILWRQRFRRAKAKK